MTGSNTKYVNQKILLKIVKAWKIEKKPEYRGFRCAHCQRYMHKAWHYFLKTGGYRTPVHFCNLCKAKFPIIGKGVYKVFTCDNCGRKMYKAWHVWVKKDRVLAEAHFCKKCGERLGINRQIKGIIYDLDGTIISSEKLHKSAWLFAGKKFDIYISRKMLLNQTGISNEAAAKMMLPDEKKYLTKQFVETKARYVIKNVNQIILFPAILAIIKDLLREEYKIWVCTSAHKNFVERVFNTLKPLKRIIRDSVVWREMYKKEKPFPEPLNFTIRKMGLVKSQICYVGNALSDYKTAIAAKVKFIYFCPKSQKKDSRIPKSIPVISSHKEILKLLE